MKNYKNHPIEEWRRLQGITQSEISDILGITRQTYRSRIKSISQWKIEELKTLSKILTPMYLEKFKTDVLKLREE